MTALLRIPRSLCILLGRHELGGLLVRRSDGRVRVLPHCATCGAAW
jgi:hypothetical protein